jgi:hypothetical protein
MARAARNPVLPRSSFLHRVSAALALGAGLVALSLFAGMLGYRSSEGMSWLDAFVNAAMLLSGMGPLAPPQTDAGKLFAGLYALYSGFAVLLSSAIVLAPVVQRLLRVALREHRGAVRPKEDERLASWSPD